MLSKGRCLEHGESSNPLACTLLVEAGADHANCGATRDWARVRLNIKNLRLLVVSENETSSSQLSATVDCDLHVVPDQTVIELGVALGVQDGGRVALDGAAVHDCSVGKDGAIEDAKHLVVTHVDEVPTPDRQLGEACLRPAERLDAVDDWLLVEQVLNSGRVHLELHSN